MGILDDFLDLRRKYEPKPTDPKAIWCIDVPIDVFLARVDPLGTLQVPALLPTFGRSFGGLPVYEWWEWAYRKDRELGNDHWLPPVPPQRGVWVLYHNGSHARVEGF